MAEAIANELVKVLFRKLSDEAFKRIARAKGIHKELKQLKSTLSRIQDLLYDASQKEVSQKTVKSWLNGLQHLVYDIEDVLDKVATDAIHSELAQETGASTCKVRKLLPTCCTNFSLSHRLSSKLDDINTQLENLEKRKSDLGLIKKDDKPRNTSRRSETSLPECDVVGLGVEKEELLNKLLGEDGSSQANFSILPILGMGGIGKTTLARLLYNDTKVKEHFELKAWVCVSDYFDIFKISDTILQDVTKENKEFKDLNQLQTALLEKFNNKRFLLVVDDVWTENCGDWENLVRPFLSCAPGSRIIMTTRKEQLLKKLGFQNVDRLKILSHEDALCLFALHALGVNNFDSHTTLKPQGEGIVKKCGCLPLALKAIGRSLRTKTDNKDWDEVLHSDIWDIENANDTENGKDLENSDKIVPALRLSYHDLSADLKRLFAYCSLFPKDFLFDKEELVLLWMAEGFLNPSNATKSSERLGLEYFEILLSRSFFQHAPNDESLFIMHDLMNDLANFVAREFFLRFDNHTKTGIKDLAKYRHVSFTPEEYEGYHKFEALKEAKSLRTLLALPIDVHQNFFLSGKVLINLLPRLTLLRVLSLRNFAITEVPDTIGSLKHLRYLNLSGTGIKELPEFVANLYNLQTLIVKGCKELTKLPKSFLNLKRLRHFDIESTPLSELPLGIGELESFTSLSIRMCRNLASLPDLPNLTSLSICWCENLVSLHNLPNLTSLSILYCESLVSLPDLSNLTSLTIKDCKNLVSLHDLSNLTSLSILNCESVVSLPNLSSLTSLLVRDCSSLVSLPDLPNLTSLSISWCQNLVSLHELSNLTSLSILLCKSLVSLRDLPNLTHLSIEECQSLVSLLNISNLTSLSIKECRSLVSLLPDLTNLTSLTIRNGGSLVLPELSNLTLLKDMKILSCPSLDSSFPSGVWPPNLCSLEIGALKKPISEWGDQNFPASLVNLELWGDDESDEVRNFSEMSHLFPSSLTSLGILGFDNLESLSTELQHLTSLQHLTIGYCENVNDLPETLLPSLLSLTTIHCPKLPER